MAIYAWTLWFIREHDEDPDVENLIGVYSTEELANAAKERATLLPQFNETPNDTLAVSRDELDTDGWETGFVHM
ncbi:MAG: hypothetical protein AB7O88_27930 [Reyranellaceae bacterium]